MKALSSQDPIDALAGVGPKLKETLARCNIKTIEHLLFHLPFKYQDRTKITPISQLQENDWAVVVATITNAQVILTRRKQFICTLTDGTGTLKVRFFYFNQGLKQALRPGVQLKLFSEIKFFNQGYEAIHPEFDIITEEPLEIDEETLTPIYHLTAGLSQKKLRALCKIALDSISPCDLNLLAFKNENKQNTLYLDEMLKYLHNPPPSADVKALVASTHPYQKALAKEELLTNFITLKEIKDESKKDRAHPFNNSQTMIQQFLESLPFKLTNSQEVVSQEILSDLNKPYPMKRLVQGDVGSGKTVVAAIAALMVLKESKQVALMAPTELLAEQHFKNFNTWFEPLNLKCILLLGKQSANEQKRIRAEIKSSSKAIVIGTHALFQEKVVFNELSLVIIDEQHRFGVKQRLSLQEKGKQNALSPHLLIMTATPIPRTLAMIQYANLDLSSITELPPNRKAIQTSVIDNNKRPNLIEKIKHQLNEGVQGYWICPLIEESESLQCEAAEKTFQTLKGELPGIRVGLVHGRLKAIEKLSIMNEFKGGKIDLLVATTVIEVGVDVPNASLMVIENAERLGLFQLHQLRGRVGRGSKASHCLLLYKSPLSKLGKARLKAIRENSDGFKIAELDLKLRGAGEILGTRQTGLSQFKIANLERDQDIIESLPTLAKDLIKLPEDTLKKLKNRWLNEGEQYSKT